MPGALAPDPVPVDTDPLHCFSSPGSATHLGWPMAAAWPCWPGSSGTIRIAARVGRHPKVPAGWNIAARRSVTRRCYRPAGGRCQGIRPRSRARAPAWVRSAAPSLPRIWVMCFLTVSSATTRSRAMRWLGLPAASSRSTSSSRPVSGSARPTYPRAIWDEDQGRLISDAEVAEVPYTAFASKKGKAITARLIVRRVKDLNRKAAGGQDELFTIWRYHALFTDSPFEMIQAEAHHRDHAIVEQVFADLASGPLAHLPYVD